MIDKQRLIESIQFQIADSEKQWTIEIEEKLQDVLLALVAVHPWPWTIRQIPLDQVPQGNPPRIKAPNDFYELLDDGVVPVVPAGFANKYSAGRVIHDSWSRATTEWPYFSNSQDNNWVSGNFPTEPWSNRVAVDPENNIVFLRKVDHPYRVNYRALPDVTEWPREFRNVIVSEVSARMKIPLEGQDLIGSKAEFGMSRSNLQALVQSTQMKDNGNERTYSRWEKRYRRLGPLRGGVAPIIVPVIVPIISSINPPTAKVGELATVSGSNLNLIAAFSVGGTAVPLTNVTGSTATFTVPPVQPGTYATDYTYAGGAGTGAGVTVVIDPANVSPLITGLSGADWNATAKTVSVLSELKVQGQNLSLITEFRAGNILLPADGIGTAAPTIYAPNTAGPYAIIGKYAGGQTVPLNVTVNAYPVGTFPPPSIPSVIFQKEGQNGRFEATPNVESIRYPSGVPNSFNWKYGTSGTNDVLPTVQGRGPQLAGAAYCQIYQYGNPRVPSKDTRVEMAEVRVQYFSIAQNKWVLLATGFFEGAAFKENFVEDLIVGADIFTLPTGIKSVRAGTNARGDAGKLIDTVVDNPPQKVGFNFHGFLDRFSINWADCRGIMVTCPMRAVGPGASTSPYIVDVGVDSWASTTSAYDGFATHGGVNASRFIPITEEWQNATFYAGPNALLTTNPPLGFGPPDVTVQLTATTLAGLQTEARAAIVANNAGPTTSELTIKFPPNLTFTSTVGTPDINALDFGPLDGYVNGRRVVYDFNGMILDGANGDWPKRLPSRTAPQTPTYPPYPGFATLLNGQVAGQAKLLITAGEIIKYPGATAANPPTSLEIGIRFSFGMIKTIVTNRTVYGPPANQDWTYDFNPTIRTYLKEVLDSGAGYLVGPLLPWVRMDYSAGAKSDRPKLRITGVSNLTVKGLIIQNCNQALREYWSSQSGEEQGAPGVTALGYKNLPTLGIRVMNANNCIFTRNKLWNLEGMAASERRNKGTVWRENTIQAIGNCGLGIDVTYNGDPADQDLGFGEVGQDYVIERNLFYECGASQMQGDAISVRLGRSYRISQNIILRTGANGIAVGWFVYNHTDFANIQRNYTVKENLIEQSNLNCPDGAAIYSLGDSQGSIISDNTIRRQNKGVSSALSSNWFVFENDSVVAGIYMDNASTGVGGVRNLIEETSGSAVNFYRQIQATPNADPVYDTPAFRAAFLSDPIKQWANRPLLTNQVPGLASGIKDIDATFALYESLAAVPITVTGISPISVVQNTTVTLRIFGSGFSPTNPPPVLIYPDGTGTGAPATIGTTWISSSEVQFQGWTVGSTPVGPHAINIAGSTSANQILQVQGVATPTPTLSVIAPASVPQGGELTFTGTNFVSGATVTIGGTANIAATFVSATTLRAFVPPNQTIGASVACSVKNPDGQSSETQNVAITAAATITFSGMSPTTVQQNTTVNLSLFGTGFQPGSPPSVLIYPDGTGGGSPAVIGTTYVSSTEVRFNGWTVGNTSLGAHAVNLAGAASVNQNITVIA
jgi:IPT/TIG domain